MSSEALSEIMTGGTKMYLEELPEAQALKSDQPGNTPGFAWGNLSKPLFSYL
jgi:hypothetical protein